MFGTLFPALGRGQWIVYWFALVFYFELIHTLHDLSDSDATGFGGAFLDVHEWCQVTVRVERSQVFVLRI